MSHSGLHAVVLNYCQLDETLGCVEALGRAGLPRARILVVDNASPDGSGDALEQRLEAARLLRLPENRGFGAGNNAAIEALWSVPGSEPTHVFIANPDVRVRPDTLDALSDVLEGGRRGGATCVQHDRANPERLDAFFRTWIQNRNVDVATLGDQSFIPLNSLLGAAMMLTREAIEHVGGFDPLYFMYGEEEDLARRLRYHGFTVGLACHARVLHGRPYLGAKGEEEERRATERRTSRRLFLLKDPFRGTAFNMYRVLRLAGSELAGALTRRRPALGVWWKEMVWLGRQVLPALAHRRQEMRGRAHLALPGSRPSLEGPFGT